MLLRILTVLYGLKSFYTGSCSLSLIKIYPVTTFKNVKEVEIFKKVLYSVIGAFYVS